jgi:hypothetical protein
MTRVWHDAWATLLYYVNILIQVGFFGYAIQYISLPLWHPQPITTSNSSHHQSSSHAIMQAIRQIFSYSNPILTTLTASTFGFLIIGTLILSLLTRFPRAMIHSGFAVSLASSIVLLAFLTLNGAIHGTNLALSSIGILLQIGAYYRWRHRIALSALVLEASASVVQRFPILIGLSLANTAFQAVYFFAWLFTLSEWVTRYPSYEYPIFIYASFCLAWQISVATNALHTIVASVFGRVYSRSQEVQSSPVSNAVVQSLTTSFGSICFGSLFVSLIQTARILATPFISMAEAEEARDERRSNIKPENREKVENITRNYRASRSRQQQDTILKQILRWLLDQLEKLLHYFNQYAFVQVGMYGRSYLEAASSTFTLLTTSGIQFLIQENILQYVFAFMSLIAAVLSGFYHYVVATQVLQISTNQDMTLFVGLAVVVSAGIMHLLLNLLRSGTITFFVCFAEQPQTIRQANPALYNRFQMAIQGKSFKSE